MREGDMPMSWYAKYPRLGETVAERQLRRWQIVRFAQYERHEEIVNAAMRALGTHDRNGFPLLRG